MKRIASILLLGILLFNWGGYRLVTAYLENRADARLEANLDQNNYKESDLVSIKVPADLSDYASTGVYERVSGEITVKGVSYKYVKRRLYNNSIEFLCIPNIGKTTVQRAGQDFYRLANDVAANNPSKKSTGNNHTHLTKFSVQDFTDDHYSFSWQFKVDDHSKTWNRMNAEKLMPDYRNRLERPPQA